MSDQVRINFDMRTETVKFGGNEFQIRAYESSAQPFRRPIDRLILHLAYHTVDDYCNPPGFAWAALIREPFLSLRAFKLLGSAKLTDDELAFIAAARAAIIMVSRSRDVCVRYFDNEDEAKGAWTTIKLAAQSP